MPEDHLLELVQRNLELTEKLTKDMKKIRHHFWLSSVWMFMKMLILFAPIVGGYFYLRPYLGKVQETYAQILGIQQSVKGLKEDIGQLQQGAKSIGKATQDISGGGQGLPIPSLEMLQGLFGKK